MISDWNTVQLISDNQTEIFLLRFSPISDIEHAFTLYTFYCTLLETLNSTKREIRVIEIKGKIVTEITQQIAKMLKLYVWTRNVFNQIIFGTKCICSLLLIIETLK